MIPDCRPDHKIEEALGVDETPDTLGEAQELFSIDLMRLLRFAFDMGYRVRIGAVHRSPEAQYAEYKEGNSRLDGYRRRSRHQDKLAADLFLSKEGNVTWNLADYRKLGEYWESLDVMNVWGGNWPTLRDAVHFERKPPT